MWSSARSALILVACLTVAVSPRAQQPPAQTPQPSFRGGVEIVTLDVSVLDSVRRPVRGLTAADFTLLENGKPQPIVAFAAVDVPDVEVADVAWMREVAPDVASNALAERRLILILLDDGDSGYDPGLAKFARRIGSAVIDGLGPKDVAAVAFTYQGRAQTFTADRAQLRAAVDSFAPKSSPAVGQIIPCLLKKYVGGCGIDALQHAGDALRAAPPGRKLLVYISSAAIPNADANSVDLDALAPLGQMLRTLQLSNIAVYTFAPQGLTVGKDPAESGLRMLAENTGGRATVSTNEPWAGVPEMFRENGSYYLLGFRSTAPPNDDRFRRLSIRVNRPGVEVRSRNGYFPVKPEKVKNVKGGPPSAVDSAIAKAMPTGDLPLSVATAAFAVPGRKTAELAVIAGVSDHLAEADVSRSRRVKVIATAFDTAWRSRGAATQTVELTLRPNVSGDFTYDVISRLPLAPGRYEIRYAADTEGRTGSVFVDIDVPDFAKAPLSLSGVLLQATPAVPVAPPNALSGLVPIVPTARRVFAPGDLVTAFVRVYQGSSVPLGSVTMSARAVDDRDRPVFNQTVTLDAARFSGSRAADYQVDLPLARWPAGEYLVTLDVSRGQSTAHRAVRITVR